MAPRVCRKTRLRGRRRSGVECPCTGQPGERFVWRHDCRWQHVCFSVKEGAGARSQVSNLVAWVVTIMTLLFLTPLFAPLPEAVLAALIIHAVWHIIGLPQAGEAPATRVEVLVWRAGDGRCAVDRCAAGHGHWRVGLAGIRGLTRSSRPHIVSSGARPWCSRRLLGLSRASRKYSCAGGFDRASGCATVLCQCAHR